MPWQLSSFSRNCQRRSCTSICQGLYFHFFVAGMAIRVPTNTVFFVLHGISSCTCKQLISVIGDVAEGLWKQYGCAFLGCLHLIECSLAYSDEAVSVVCCLIGLQFCSTLVCLCVYMGWLSFHVLMRSFACFLGCVLSVVCCWKCATFWRADQKTLETLPGNLLFGFLYLSGRDICPGLSRSCGLPCQEDIRWGGLRKGIFSGFVDALALCYLCPLFFPLVLWALLLLPRITIALWCHSRPCIGWHIGSSSALKWLHFGWCPTRYGLILFSSCFLRAPL